MPRLLEAAWVMSGLGGACSGCSFLYHDPVIALLILQDPAAAIEPNQSNLVATGVDWLAVLWPPQAKPDACLGEPQVFLAENARD